MVERNQRHGAAAWALCLLSLAVAGPAAAASALPTWLTLPAGARVEGDAVAQFAWDFDDLSSGK